MSRWWTTGEVAAVRRWQRDGVPQREQAARLGRTVAQVRHAVHRYGLQGHPYHARGADTRSRLIDALADGLTVRAAAGRCGIDRRRAWLLTHELMAAGLVRRHGYRGPYTPTGAWTGGRPRGATP